jgi:Undecaprenyl-phosphate glucose phosphotransferase
VVVSNFSLTDVWPHTRKPWGIFRHVSYKRVGAVTAISDFALLLAASIVAGVGYHYLVFQVEGNIEAFVAVGGYCGLIFVLVSKLLSLYQPNSLLSVRTQIRGVFVAWTAAFFLVTSLLFLLKTGENYSRGATVGFGLFAFVLLLASRAFIGLNLRRALGDGTLAGPRVIVIGDSEELSTKSSLQLLRTYGTREVARFELSAAPADPHSHIAHDLTIIDSAIKAAQAQRAEQVLLALRWVDASRRDSICERLQVLPLPVFLLPDQFVSSITRTSGDFSGGGSIEVQRAPLSQRDLIVKRLFDLVLASLCLLVLFPLLLVTCLAIKFDSAGPIIFRQRRKGFNGADFAIYKFRTMKVLEDGPTIRQALPNDDRVTRIGRLLRASSVDELPQLFNVLAGVMSLVGPRPHAVAHDEEYSHSIDKYAFRHHVKPGITGLAQVRGFRGATLDPALMDKRIQLDLWYINNWSLWLDLRIMARTLVELSSPRNAY